MKSLFFLISSSIMLLLQPVYSQNCPPNIDFEAGDFSHWECFTGTTGVVNGVNAINLTLSQPQAGRQEIISTANSGNDAYGKFPMLCPYGGKYSVKLGNDRNGAEAEGLSYTFQVPSTIDTFTFTYFYAVVFEDPGHTAPEQPRFFVTAYDVATGELINCASYNYISNGAIPGFKLSPTGQRVLYKNWSPTSLQFAGLGGRDVRLEFKTADCTLGGHFGYAYLDVGSGCSNILATAPYCKETNSLLLNAPYGYQFYTWYDNNFNPIGSEQSLTLSPPPATNGVFHVGVIPYPGYGCSDTFNAVVIPLPVPDTPVAQSYYVYCEGQYVNPLTAIVSADHILLWYTNATGGIGNDEAPVPSTTALGITDYYVSQKALFGCESFRKMISVKISPTPVVSFSINDFRQCQNGNVFVCTSTSTKLSKPVFYWDFGDGEKKSSSADSVVKHTYTTSGNFTIQLRVENDSMCYAQNSIYVSVIPKPVASFSFPAVTCEQQGQMVLTDQSTVSGGLSSISKWWWNIDGKFVFIQHPIPFTVLKAGPLLVKLVVTTQEGCTSDTVAQSIPVHYQPLSNFTSSKALCDNEVIQFTDQSIISGQALSEKIVAWSWQVDPAFVSAKQHPSLLLAQGNHTAYLSVITNFGCKSMATSKSFVVYPKPQIGLHISDSCIDRKIIYSGMDISNSVKQWYWDFGAGMHKNASIQTKSCNKEGFMPLTVIGETIHGCKDTVVRPFTIYDDKSDAGNDTIVAINQPVQLNAHGGTGVKYSWSPSIGLSSATIEKPVAVLAYDQLYKLYSITDKGCDSYSDIFIKRYAGPTLYIPTAFTPNHDGKNDILNVISVGMKSFKYFAVYDRFGLLVFKTGDPKKGWDGNYKGSEMASATFVVLAEAIDYKGKHFLSKGTVTLIR